MRGGSRFMPSTSKQPLERSNRNGICYDPGQPRNDITTIDYSGSLYDHPVERSSTSR
jgi:hypothetical protein